MIKDFITNYFKEKLSAKTNMVIYDADRFYHNLVLELASESIKVFDATENVVTVRENALRFWVESFESSTKQRIIVYVPFGKPIEEEEKVKDPFIIFGMGGSIFPDEASDNYHQLCLAALPEKRDKVEALFAQELSPSFDTIDALVDGNTYPKLKSLLNASSDTEILLSFLNPTDEQKEVLNTDKSWTSEFRLFLKTSLGVVSKARNYDSIQKDIWRIVLFSEFVYDLPIEIPASLSEVVRVKESAKALVSQVCHQLRNHKNAEEIYVHHANFVSTELKLAELFKSEKDLGEVNTFSFEDSTFFNQFANALLADNIAEASRIADRCERSIWASYDDERRSSWQIAKHILLLLDAVKQNKACFKDAKSLQQLVKLYADKMYEVDTLHRELEKEVQQVVVLSETLKRVCGYARKNYFDFVEGVQNKFQKFITNDGLDSLSITRNIDVFDKHITPLFKSGKKTVYILADAMRYELAQELSERLTRAKFACEIEPALAYIPTITKYGMAALMPNASKALNLKTKEANLLPFMDEAAIAQRKDRVRYTEDLFGDRIAWTKTEDVIKGDFDAEKELLFVTSTEVDEAGENMPDNAQLIIEQAVIKILKTCSVLRDSGYQEFVLVADHGFVLKDNFKAGDSTNKPIGDWVLRKTRCLAGKGDSNDEHIALSAYDLGIKSDVNQFLFLKNYTTYEKGKKFYHEGISLQEAITPLLKFRGEELKQSKDIQVNLSYKGKDRGYITTRRPKLELASFGETLFGDPIDLLIEAFNQETKVGEVALSDNVNSTTRYVEIVPGQSLKTTLIMDEDYEGDFKILAKDPSTGVILAEINLSTDYL